MKLEKNIYIIMLETGYSKTKEGISFDDMIVLLEKKGYDFGDGSYRSKIRTWFYQKFFNNYTLAGGGVAADVHDDADNKEAFLYGDATLQYLDYLNLKQARKSAKNSMGVAIAAIIISILVPILTGLCS